MWNFLLEFIKHPKEVWTFLPCFDSLVKNVIANIDFSKDLRIIEYWPGNWNFSKRLLENMSYNSELISFELNKDFCDNIEIKDDRFSLINDSAENVMDYIDEKVDVVLSWVPLAAVPENIRKKVIDTSYNILKDNWLFLQYQYFSFAYKDLKIKFENLRKYRVLNHLPPAIYYLWNK